jgi:predicted amidohydrolase YtcJ
MKSILLFILPFALFLTSCVNKMEADLIIKNAKIYSVDAEFGIYESMAVKEGRILAVGKNREISRYYSSDKTIDVDGRFIYPGFIDPHCHFYGYGSALQEADLRGTKSFEEVLDIVKVHAEKKDAGWIQGRGWDQNDWEDKSWPDNKKLNELFPDRPVILIRIDGHAAIVNDFALNQAGISTETRIEGGEIIVKNSKPTGVLVDNAVDKLKTLIPEHSESDIRSSLTDAQDNCFAVGLTSVHDCGLNTNVIDLMDQMQQEGSLKMRIYAMLNPTKENFEKYLTKGVYRTDRLHVAALKLYADGALGSRGALLIEPYTDDPENSGLLVASKEYLTEMAEFAYKNDYQVNTHCIGDGANRLMLEIYSGILKEKNNRRWRIEHSQVINPDDINIFGDYSIIPSIQTTHATSDMYWADERLGDRVKHAYTYKSLLEQNGWLPNGSDFPIEDINPLYGFYAGVSRRDQQGWPKAGFQPEEALSREEALKAMTIWAAKSAFEENEIGSLEPEKKADFVITDTDIMEAPEKEIFKTKVLATYIEGEKVFSQSEEKK